MKQAQLDSKLEQIREAIEGERILENCLAIVKEDQSRAKRKNVTFNNLEVEYQSIGSNPILVKYKSEIVLRASNVRDKTTPSVQVANNYHVTLFKYGDWIKELFNITQPLTDGESTHYQLSFGLHFKQKDSRLKAELQKEKISRQLTESNLVHKCILFSNLDPNKKVQEHSCHTHIKSAYQVGEVRAEYEGGMSDWGGEKLLVTASNKTCLSASNSKDPCSIVLPNQSIYVHTYLPGPWEKVIQEGMQEISPKSIEAIAKNFGIRV